MAEQNSALREHLVLIADKARAVLPQLSAFPQATERYWHAGLELDHPHYLLAMNRPCPPLNPAQTGLSTLTDISEKSSKKGPRLVCVWSVRSVRLLACCAEEFRL